MRRLIVLAILALGLAGCATSTGVPQQQAQRIEFGITGGNMPPYTVTISPTGAVSASRAGLIPKGERLSSATVRSLSAALDSSQMDSHQCSGVLPDVASRFIRTNGRTVTVHGGCEYVFVREWYALASAVALKLR